MNWKTPQKCKSVPRCLSMILSEKEVRRKKAIILRGFQAFKSVFCFFFFLGGGGLLMKDLNKSFPSFSKFPERV